MYPRCDNKATHILVDYHHNIILDNEGDARVFCEDHAFVDGRLQCPCCYDYEIRFNDESADIEIELLPTYAAGQLDGEGCCSEHP